jgi:hypothetical protein
MSTMVNKSSVTAGGGGTLTLNSVLIGNYDYTIKNGNHTVSSFTNSDWFTTTQDSNAALICVNGNLTISSGITFLPSVRKLFTCLLVNGNLTIDGTVSMTGRGANTVSLAVQTANVRIINGTYSSVTNPQIPSSGGAGGSAGSSGNGGAGSSGASGGTGGGGGGSGYASTAGNGASGSSFSGGSGGGGSNSGSGDMNASLYGGTGGTGRHVNGGNTAVGGTGNPGGSSINNNGTVNGSSFFGNDGTGGTLVIFCTGSLLGNGTISSNGVNGKNNSSAIGAGGASGGGSITVICNSNQSTITRSVSGGTGGTAYPTAPYNMVGGNGGSGTERILTGL